MKHYVETFDFGAGKKCSFDKALRTFLGSFRLPGEAQCIDRLMESFASKLYKDLGVNNPFTSGDAAFILAFSTIMLNTDLHNPGIPQSKRMTKEQFIKNNKGINDGKDLPKEYLEILFDDIKNDQIKMDIDINDSETGSTSLIFTDSNLWNKMLRKSTMDQIPAAFTPTLSARLNSLTNKYKIENGLNNIDSTYKIDCTYPPGAHEKDMFIAIAGPVLQAILTVWEVRIVLTYFTSLYFTLLYYTLLYFTLDYFTLLYFTLLYFTLLYFTSLYFTLDCFTLLYFTLLYFTLLYFTLLYFTLDYFTSFLIILMPIAGNECANGSEVLSLDDIFFFSISISILIFFFFFFVFFFFFFFFLLFSIFIFISISISSSPSLLLLSSCHFSNSSTSNSPVMDNEPNPTIITSYK